MSGRSSGTPRPRVPVLTGIAVLGAVVLGAPGVAWAQPAAPSSSSAVRAAPTHAPGGASGPSPSAPPAPSTDASTAVPRTLCRLTDPRLPELSGLVVAGDRMIAINDGGDSVAVYVLDAACRVVDVRTAPVDPYDPEDLAVGADGSVWLADIGDNRAERSNVALIVLRPDGSTQTFRLTYPDGPHDAEALLLAPDGTPYLVTKELLGVSGVYRPSGRLTDAAPVRLDRVGQVAFAPTGTPGGPAGRAGQVLVTGGAVSRDGRLLALRTYTDAYVWPLTGSDVARALTGKPVRVPLPAAPQGEAISFAADNRQLVAAGEGLPGEVFLVPGAPGLPASPAGGSSGKAAPAGRTRGLPPVQGAAVAVAVATGVVWLASRLRRRT